MTDWVREQRVPPPQIAAEAAANPGGSVSEIDGSMIPDPNGYVPAEAILGAYVVGPDGRATGEYLRNPGYGPIRDDLARLEQPDTWIGWLPEPPSMAIRTAIHTSLTDQIPGTRLEWLKVVEEPAYIAAGKPAALNPETLVVTRAGIAVPFALSALPPSGRRDVFTGVFTWIAAGLDGTERRDRVWFDVGMSRVEAELLLNQRAFDV